VDIGTELWIVDDMGHLRCICPKAGIGSLLDVDDIEANRKICVRVLGADVFEELAPLMDAPDLRVLGVEAVDGHNVQI
jgi:hypothetical protein